MQPGRTILGDHESGVVSEPLFALGASEQDTWALLHQINESPRNPAMLPIRASLLGAE